MFLFEVLTSSGFVLTVLGGTAMVRERALGPAASGRLTHRERHASAYVRVGPPLLAAGLIGMLALHWA